MKEHVRLWVLALAVAPSSVLADDWSSLGDGLLLGFLWLAIAASSCIGLCITAIIRRSWAFSVSVPIFLLTAPIFVFAASNLPAYDSLNSTVGVGVLWLVATVISLFLSISIALELQKRQESRRGA